MNIERAARQKSRKLMPNRRQALAAFALAVALLLVNDTFVFESVVIPTESMEPTILANERIFLRKFPRPTIRRFDVIAIGSHVLRRRLAKRVIGLPGDRVRLEDGWKVYINGEPLSYAAEDADHRRIESADHAIQINPKPPVMVETRFAKTDLLLGPDEYFVLGDNRLSSDDSRFIGPIHAEEIEGKLGLIWYSFDIARHRVRRERLLRIP